MTEDEFFALLGRAGRQWELVGGDCIRTHDLSPGTDLPDCPITAAYYAVKDGSVDPSLAYWAGEQLGLDMLLIERLLTASEIPAGEIADKETFRIRIRLLAELVWK